MRSSWMRKSGQDSHLLLLSEQPSAHSQDTCNETYGIPLACLQMSAEQRHAQALQAQLHKEQAARRQLEKQAAVLQVEVASDECVCSLMALGLTCSCRCRV